MGWAGVGAGGVNSKGGGGERLQGPHYLGQEMGHEIPGEGQGKAVTLKKASSKTSNGPEKPTTSSGWAPSREKRTPSTAVDTISSDTPISPSVFSPGAGKGQWEGPGLAPSRQPLLFI